MFYKGDWSRPPTLLTWSASKPASCRVGEINSDTLASVGEEVKFLVVSWPLSTFSEVWRVCCLVGTLSVFCRTLFFRIWITLLVWNSTADIKSCVLRTGWRRHGQLSFLVSISISCCTNRSYDGSCAQRKKIAAIHHLYVSHVTTGHFPCSLHELLNSSTVKQNHVLSCSLGQHGPEW